MKMCFPYLLLGVLQQNQITRRVSAVQPICINESTVDRGMSFAFPLHPTTRVTRGEVSERIEGVESGGLRIRLPTPTGPLGEMRILPRPPGLSSSQRLPIRCRPMAKIWEKIGDGGSTSLAAWLKFSLPWSTACCTFLLPRFSTLAAVSAF